MAVNIRATILRSVGDWHRTINRMFSELTQATMADPQYGGPLENFTHCGASGAPGDGPFVQIWMECAPGKREEGRVGGEGESAVIVRAAYKSNGCPSSMAAGAMAARVLTGLTIEKALLLTGEDLLRIMGGVPEGKEECAFRAIAAVRDAIGR